jgi:hypothetical protein
MASLLVGGSQRGGSQMNEVGKSIIYVVLIALLLATLALAPAVVGVAELADRHRVETGQGQ